MSGAYEPSLPDPVRRTAVLIVAGPDTPADQTFEAIRTLYGDFFTQIVFLSVGIVDYDVLDARDFISSEVPVRLREAAGGVIERCAKMARQAGLETLTCLAIGTDPAQEVERQSIELARMCPGAVFFVGKFVFRRGRWWHSLLHGRTVEAIQKKLENRGLPVTVIPVVLPP